jgi:CheY-like chemotaxis protein
MPFMPVLWLIDDTPSNHDLTAITVERVEGWCFQGFYSSTDAIRWLRRQTGNGLWPDVVLLDYYLDGERGDQVVGKLKQALPKNVTPVLIGYSSVRSCSEAIVAAGADLVLSKRGDGVNGNEMLRRWLEAWPSV